MKKPPIKSLDKEGGRHFSSHNFVVSYIADFVKYLVPHTFISLVFYTFSHSRFNELRSIFLSFFFCFFRKLFFVFFFVFYLILIFDSIKNILYSTDDDVVLPTSFQLRCGLIVCLKKIRLEIGTCFSRFYVGTS